MKKTMLKKYFAVLLAAAIAALCPVSAALAWDSGAEIARLKKEVPSFETFGVNSAVIWLRDYETSILADGSMDIYRRTIIMMGEHVPADWKIQYFPIPTGGEVSVDEAAWYNTMTGASEGRLPVKIIALPGGAPVLTIEVPEDTVGRAVVIATHEKRPNSYGVDETINMAGSLPIWEQNVSVELPGGMELFWIGRDMKEPSVFEQNNVRRYKWQTMNQLPWHGEGFVLNERPMLSFSTRKGASQSIRKLEELARSIPPVPVPAVGKTDRHRTCAALAEYLAAPARTLTGFQPDYVRNYDTLPAEGPWSEWEKTFILKNWLESLGFEAALWWEAKMPVDEAAPASATIFEAPVLEITDGASKKSYYKAGLPFSFSKIPFSIGGSDIYTVSDEGLISKRIPAGASADNRFYLLWKLRMDEAGAAEGTLDVSVTGGWSELFSGGNVPGLSGLSEFLIERINFAIPGMRLEPVKVDPLPSGYRMSFAVRCVPGIIHGGNLLLRLPGGIPIRVSEMISQEKQYTLRFPFIIDQKVRMDMPKGYRMLQMPPLKNVGDGTKAVLKESITHWPKKAELLADSLWAVKTRTVDSLTAQLMKEELAAALRWPVLDLPFKK
ncbi:MAG: hypothetical protein IJM42_03935 [Synergistes sp.]|nr:hypothetical protein [Synergistes sp.]